MTEDKKTPPGLLGGDRKGFDTCTSLMNHGVGD